MNERRSYLYSWLNWKRPGADLLAFEYDGVNTAMLVHQPLTRFKVGRQWAVITCWPLVYKEYRTEAQARRGFEARWRNAIVADAVRALGVR